MATIIFSITALISFFGGMVILAKSGARYGRTMAAGLLFLSLMEVLYLAFALTGSLAVLLLASLFEISCTSAFLLSVTSMESRLAKNTALVRGERSFLFLACAAYALVAALFSGSAFSLPEGGGIHLGWVMKVQSVGLLVTATELTAPEDIEAFGTVLEGVLA